VRRRAEIAVDGRRGRGDQHGRDQCSGRDCYKGEPAGGTEGTSHIGVLAFLARSFGAFATEFPKAFPEPLHVFTTGVKVRSPQFARKSTDLGSGTFRNMLE